MNETPRPALRDGLPPLPERLRALPVDRRGYPIPWFVYTADDGTRDFRIADAAKRVRAVKEKLCWICGGKLGRFLVFAIGPMCAVNRNTSEPPAHRECAEFAAMACPFLTLPAAQYRRAGLPEDYSVHPHSLPGNPGGVVLWVTYSFKPYRVPGQPKNWLIEIGPAVEVVWFTHGRLATRDEARALVDARLHLLREVAEHDGPKSVAALDRQVAEALKWLPAERSVAA